jgi:hypothetical protein
MKRRGVKQQARPDTAPRYGTGSGRRVNWRFGRSLPPQTKQPLISRTDSTSEPGFSDSCVGFRHNSQAETVQTCRDGDGGREGYTKTMRSGRCVFCQTSLMGGRGPCRGGKERIWRGPVSHWSPWVSWVFLRLRFGRLRDLSNTSPFACLLLVIAVVARCPPAICYTRTRTHRVMDTRPVARHFSSGPRLCARTN